MKKFSFYAMVTIVLFLFSWFFLAFIISGCSTYDVYPNSNSSSSNPSPTYSSLDSPSPSPSSSSSPVPSPSPSLSPSPPKTTSVSGKVLDASGNPISGVLVEVVSLDKRVKVDEVRTDDEGNYSVDGLVYGEKYLVSFSKSGYSVVKSSTMVEEDELNLAMDVVMPSGDGECTVDVSKVSILQKPEVDPLNGKVSFKWSKSVNDGFVSYILCKSTQHKATPWDTILGEYGIDERVANNIDQIPKGLAYHYALFEKIDIGNGAFVYVSKYGWSTKFKRLEWGKNFGGGRLDMGCGIVPLNDGGYIISGYTGSNDGDVQGGHGNLGDFWVFRIDADHRLVWQRCIGGSGSETRGRVVPSLTGDEFFVLGSAHSEDGDCQDSLGGGDVLLVKFDKDGNIVNSARNCFGGSRTDWPWAIALTKDGGCIIAGYSSSCDGDVQRDCDNNMVIWVAKFDSNKNVEWSKVFGVVEEDILGAGIVQAQDGGYVLVSTADPQNDLVTGRGVGKDIWVVKLDSGGNMVWQRCIDGLGDEGGRGVAVTPSGDYIVLGCTGVNDEYGDAYDFFIAKVDKEGNLLWTKKLGGSKIDMPLQIISDGKGGCLAVGATGSIDGDVKWRVGTERDVDVWALRLDKEGNILWSKCLGSNAHDLGYCAAQTPSGHFVIVGYSSATGEDVASNYGDRDVWVFELDENGSFPEALKE